MDNSRYLKFKELAEKRVNRTIKDIRLIANLANKSNYSFTETDAQKICLALDSELKLLKQKFLQEDGKSSRAFKL